MILITEAQFRIEINKQLMNLLLTTTLKIGCVTGPGRSGAIAAVYASHILRVPFIPYGSKCPVDRGTMLVIDTASESGRTLRKACRRYPGSIGLAIYNEPPRVAFWYESSKPQYYNHEVVI